MLVDAADKLEDTRQQIHQAPKHLNTFVVGKYKELVRSEMGEWALTQKTQGRPHAGCWGRRSCRIQRGRQDVGHAVGSMHAQL